MTAKIIDPTKDSRWDEFVCKHPRGTVYHLSHWMRVLSSAYDHDPFCVVFEDQGILTAGIPFMRAESALTGKRLVSLPFTAYCQPLADPDLFRRGIDCALDHHPDVTYFETRLFSGDPAMADDLQSLSRHQIHLLKLDPSLEDLMSSFHHSTRRSIRKAETNKLDLKFGESERDVRAFFRLEVAVRKKHGLPPQPYRFFAQMWRVLNPVGLLSLPMVMFQGRVVAAAMLLRFNDTVHYEYAGSDSDFLRLRPNHKLLWQTIQIARHSGARIYDFGRTSNSHDSLLMFKDRWGAQRRALHYFRTPETPALTRTDGFWRSKATSLNRFTPSALLRLQGEVLYPHLV